MISKFQLFAAALAGILVCSVAGAQVHNVPTTTWRSPGHGRSAARASANSRGTAATGMQSSQQSSVIQISPSGRMISGLTPDADTFSFDGNSGVPGLGFDFPHLAAISGAQRNTSFPHFGHNGRHGQGSFVPILFGGYPYYDSDLGYDQPEQQMVQPSQVQPQIIVIQQPVPAQQQAADSADDTGSVSATVPAAQPALPIPDVGDFILVRRDGRILFASVFSVVGSQLQYVTPEGIRHSIAISDLDADATQQMNEARGTTVQIHN
jgi:hypothetical protein